MNLLAVPSKNVLRLAISDSISILSFALLSDCGKYFSNRKSVVRRNKGNRKPACFFCVRTLHRTNFGGGCDHLINLLQVVYYRYTAFYYLFIPSVYTVRFILANNRTKRNKIILLFIHRSPTLTYKTRKNHVV